MFTCLKWLPKWTLKKYDINLWKVEWNKPKVFLHALKKQKKEHLKQNKNSHIKRPYHHHHQIVLTARSSLTLSLSLSLSLSLVIHFYLPSFLAGPLACIQCPHRADVRVSFLVNHHKRKLLMSLFPSSTRYALLVLLGRFERLEVSGHTAALSRVYFQDL